MSYAIIRNVNHKIGAVPLAERHNERRNKNYSNKDIDLSRLEQNYHLKEPTSSYLETFYQIREQENLKGNLRVNGRKQSTILCEFVITSDKEFFDRIGEEQTHQFFEDAYKFVCHKAGGEQYIVSAAVHMDESTPHMHCSFIPVVSGIDKKGQPCNRVNCSEFWKGRDSYSRLQDEFYDWVTSHGYDLERGCKGSTAVHLSTEEYKLKKVQEHYNEISAKAIDTKRKMDLDNEAHFALQKKSQHYYTIATEKIEEAKQAKKDITLEKNKIEQYKTMLEKSYQARCEEMNRVIRELERIKSEYKQKQEEFKTYVSNQLTMIQSVIKQAEIEKSINDNLRTRTELSAELDLYVEAITHKVKSKERGFSI